MKRAALKSTLRGAIGFTAGAVVAGILWHIGDLMMEGQSRPADSASFLQWAAFFVPGAVGGAALTWGRASFYATVRAAVGFGVGLLVAAVVGFVVTYIGETSAPAVAPGAIGFGIGYALGGGLGGLFIAPRFALRGAFSFGLTGAAGAALLFALDVYAEASAAHTAVIAVLALLIPYAIGGAVFGALVGGDLD